MVKQSYRQKAYYDSLTDEERNSLYQSGLGKWKDENPDKLREAWDKAAQKRKGSNNGSAKQIDIFNNNGELVFECHGNIQHVCKENNMPFNKFKESYLNEGKPLYQSKYGQTIAKKYGFEKYIGWYAKYKETE